MGKKGILRLLGFIVGCAIGISLLPFLWKILPVQGVKLLESSFFNSLVGGIIFLILTMIFENKIIKKLGSIDQILSKYSLNDILVHTVGIILGLVVGALLSIPFYKMNVDIVDNVIPASIMLVFAYLGYYITKNRAGEITKLTHHKTNYNSKITAAPQQYKILDTNVIIDGRIYDIAKTGFLEGVLLIPNFVLYELQYIADSSDNLKRVRGRRGLDILNSLQKEENIEVEMYEGDFEDIDEVDTKIIHLAKKLGASIVTNDYNLNKVSEFQNIEVLNINELANAVKPVVIPGEKMTVTIVKSGKEKNQGVAYLDDGTMIVIENGINYLDERIDVYVTSAIQTAAGRMVFAKPYETTSKEN